MTLGKKGGGERRKEKEEGKGRKADISGLRTIIVPLLALKRGREEERREGRRGKKEKKERKRGRANHIVWLDVVVELCLKFRG